MVMSLITGHDMMSAGFKRIKPFGYLNIFCFLQVMHAAAQMIRIILVFSPSNSDANPNQKGMTGMYCNISTAPHLPYVPYAPLISVSLSSILAMRILKHPSKL